MSTLSWSDPSTLATCPKDSKWALTWREVGTVDVTTLLLRMAQVVDDCRRVLGPMPEHVEATETLVLELYGSTRLMLSVLSREQLQTVCSGWNCDMYDILQPVRATRPSISGGSGADEDVVWDHVRDLNLVLGPPDPQPEEPAAY